MSIRIDENICTASTLPGSFYCDPKIYEAQKDLVFVPSWQFIDQQAELGETVPSNLLPGCLDEPIILSRTEEKIHCLSNVCTHRAAIIVTEPCKHKTLRCGYHGRRFRHDGQFVSMPGFQGACDFPSASDNLPALAHAQLGALNFVSIKPRCSFDDWTAPLKAKMPWYDWSGLPAEATQTQAYEFNANWALYCDNYLEGLHVPFVHPGLNQAIDLQSYDVEIFDWGTVQTAMPSQDEPVFPDGKSAYYFWLYPNLMLNFYPWGLSVNTVLPQGVDRTRVEFSYFVVDAAKRNIGAGANLEQVEMEDEAVVELVQRGVRSRLYTRGRYSPQHEKSVHRFHQLLARDLVPTI